MKLQDIINCIEKIFPKQLLTAEDSYSIDHHSFLYAIASLLQVYNQMNSIIIEKNVLPSNANPNMNLDCTIIDNKKLKEGLEHATTHLSRWGSITEVTDKIDLLRIR